jgi:hypothetical protein
MRLPDPEILLAKSVPCVTSFDLLKVKVPSFVIALLVDRLPEVPPFPICNVPALMVVVPL